MNSSKSVDIVYLLDGLKFNFLSVSQLCNKGNQVIFNKEKFVVKNPYTRNIFITTLIRDNVYVLNTNKIAT